MLDIIIILHIISIFSKDYRLAHLTHVSPFLGCLPTLAGNIKIAFDRYP